MFGCPNDLNSTLEVNGELKLANELVSTVPLYRRPATALLLSARDSSRQQLRGGGSIPEARNSCPTIETVLLAKIEEETFNLKIVIKV
jgi:hypothetical protein